MNVLALVCSVDGCERSQNAERSEEDQEKKSDQNQHISSKVGGPGPITSVSDETWT